MSVKLYPGDLDNPDNLIPINEDGTYEFLGDTYHADERFVRTAEGYVFEHHLDEMTEDGVHMDAEYGAMEYKAEIEISHDEFMKRFAKYVESQNSLTDIGALNMMHACDLMADSPELFYITVYEHMYNDEFEALLDYKIRRRCAYYAGMALTRLLYSDLDAEYKELDDKHRFVRESANGDDW